MWACQWPSSQPLSSPQLSHNDSLWAGNATDPIWRVLAFSLGISSWTPLKPQYSNPNPNPNPLANQLWCIDFLTTLTPLIIPHRLPAFLESLMPLKNWCSIHARCSKSSLKQSIHFYGIFSKFKTELYCILFFLTSRLHFWNSPAVTIRVYSNCCCSCSFETEIIKIGQYSNNTLNFQESMTILNASTKKSGNLLNAPCIMTESIWCQKEKRKDMVVF